MFNILLLFCRLSGPQALAKIHLWLTTCSSLALAIHLGWLKFFVSSLHCVGFFKIYFASSNSALNATLLYNLESIWLFFTVMYASPFEIVKHGDCHVFSLCFDVAVFNKVRRFLQGKPASYWPALTSLQHFLWKSAVVNLTISNKTYFYWSFQRQIRVIAPLFQGEKKSLQGRAMETGTWTQPGKIKIVKANVGAFLKGIALGRRAAPFGPFHLYGMCQ